MVLLPEASCLWQQNHLFMQQFFPPLPEIVRSYIFHQKAIRKNVVEYMYILQCVRS